jgi:hypothetical protein
MQEAWESGEGWPVLAERLSTTEEPYVQTTSLGAQGLGGTGGGYLRE